jgi:RNA polymerase sigma factor (sigma-70 family)
VFSVKGSKVEDHFLIRQVLDGNANAFRFLVLRYQKPVFRYLKSFGLSDPQVEEIAQDAFIKAYKGLSNYQQDKGQFNTWLFVIAKNSALNAISKHAHIKEVYSDEEFEEIQNETPLSSLEKSGLKKNINHSVNQLPIPFKNVITLFHFNELSMEEISEIEQCNLGTVKSRLHRAKSMLKEIILKNYGSEAL